MPSIETELALRQTFAATFDANVTASVLIGPNAPYTRWVLTRYSVVCPTINGGVTFTLYRGDPSQGNVLDTTLRGARATSSANDIELTQGQYVVAQWTNGVVGQAAQITIEGSIFAKGWRGYAFPS
jgi:hypothetical protein